MKASRIEIEAELTFEDFFYTIVSRSFNVRWIFVIAAFIVIVPLTLASFIIIAFAKGEWIVTLLIFGLPIIMFSSLFYYYYRIAKKLAARSKSKIQWSFSDAGYSVATDTGNANVSWNGIDEIIEIKNHFLVVVQNPLYFIIPKRFFDESQINEFKELIRRKLGDKARLKS